MDSCNPFMHTCTCRKYPIIYINIQGYSKHSIHHTYTFFWKEYSHTCSRYCAKITYVHILTILLPQTTHTHLKYFINIQIFCCSMPIYLYIYAHWRANLTSRTHLHLKRNFHAIYLHLRSNSTSYIHLGSILVPFLAWVHFFLKGFLCYLSTNIHILKGIFTLPIHKYTFLKCIIYYSFTLQGIFMPYIHTLCNIFLCHIYLHIYLHTIEKHLPRYLGAKCQSWGSPNSYKQVPIFMLF